MDLDKEKATAIAKEYLALMLDIKSKKKQADKLKEALLEEMSLSNTSDFSFACGNSYWVEVETKINYELSEVPYEVDVKEAVMSQDVFEEAFTTKLSLSRKGRKLVKKGDEFLRTLLIPAPKQVVKIVQEKK